MLRARNGESAANSENSKANSRNQWKGTPESGKIRLVESKKNSERKKRK
jgi:hypothetical protein